MTENSVSNTRVSIAYSCETPKYDDCNGHRTHITDTMAGYHYGLAKDVTKHSCGQFGLSIIHARILLATI